MTRKILLLSALVLLSCGKAFAESNPLPQGAKLQHDTTDTTITFKDGSVYQEDPTDLTIKGQEALVWWFQKPFVRQSILFVFNPKDIAELSYDPGDTKITFTDGSELRMGAGGNDTETSGGKASEYLNLLIQYRKSHPKK